MATATLASDLQDLSVNGGVEVSPFPVKSKQAAGLVNGTETDVSCLNFADKILITVSQGGRLSQWIQVPLSSASPTSFDTALPADSGDMLPLAHLTPKTLLGGGGEQRETLGHLYATQIASMISTRSPDDMRTLLVGFGLQKVEMEREAFFDLLELVQKVL